MNGLLFTVNSIVDANNFTITFDSTGGIGGTPATAGSAQKVIPSYFSPHNVVIGPTAVVATATGQLLLNVNTVPSVSQAPSQYSPFLRPYQPGAIIRLYIPAGFGTSITASFLLCQIVQFNSNGGAYAINNNMQLQILQTGNLVGSPKTATGLAALVYPTGAAAFKSSFPFVTDIAEIVPNLSEAEDNAGILGIIIGTGVQTTGKLYQWFSQKGYSI
jgi:hypothetical protein